jgi:hypothetical protein
MTSYYVEWTVSVPMRGGELDSAIDAVLDSLAHFNERTAVRDVDCGAALDTGLVDFCGYVTAPTVDDAYRTFTTAVRAILVDWPAILERSVHIEAPEPAVA